MTGSPTDGGAQNSITDVDTTPILYQQCQVSWWGPKSPTLEGYSLIKWTVATPLQLAHSPVCKALSEQPWWKSFQHAFHLSPVLLADTHPKQISWRWIRWPKPREPKTEFRAGLELNTCSLVHGHLVIGEKDAYSAAWLIQQDTCVHHCYWGYWEPYSVQSLYLLDPEPPSHYPLAPEPPLQFCLCCLLPQRFLSVARTLAGLISSQSGTAEIHVMVRYFTAKQAFEWIHVDGI